MSFLLICLAELKSSGEESPSLCSRGTRTVCLFPVTPKQGTRSIPPSSSSPAFQSQGISDPQGSLPPSCRSVTCSSLQPLCQVLPTSRAWWVPSIPVRLAAWDQHLPRAGGPAGFQVLHLGHKGCVASTQAKPDSSPCQTQLLYRN